MFAYRLKDLFRSTAVTPTLASVATIALLYGCASAPTQTAKETVEPVAPGIVVEFLTNKQKPTLPTVRITPGSDARYGTSLDWDADAISARALTTYVYLIGNLDETVPDQASALKFVDQQFVLEMESAQEKGYYQSVSDLKAAPTEFRVNAISGERIGLKRSMMITGGERGERIRSYTYLFYREPFAVKYRISFESGRIDAEALADKFVRESYPELSITWPQGCQDFKKAGGGVVAYNTNAEEAVRQSQILEGISNALKTGSEHGCYDAEAIALAMKIRDQQTKKEQMNE